tara:strand:+ start:4590 stop:4715 length:126 start_codon:yes stop_codon:yes gene_type:complete
MKTFKKQLVYFDSIGFKNAVDMGQRKIQIFKQALALVSRQV